MLCPTVTHSDCNSGAGERGSKGGSAQQGEHRAGLPTWMLRRQRGPHAWISTTAGLTAVHNGILMYLAMNRLNRCLQVS